MQRPRRDYPPQRAAQAEQGHAAEDGYPNKLAHQPQGALASPNGEHDVQPGRDEHEEDEESTPDEFVGEAGDQERDDYEDRGVGHAVYKQSEDQWRGAHNSSSFSLPPGGRSHARSRESRHERCTPAAHFFGARILPREWLVV